MKDIKAKFVVEHDMNEINGLLRLRLDQLRRQTMKFIDKQNKSVSITVRTFLNFV